MTTAPATRTERDPLGALEVPADALYGVQTLRAVRNFQISGLKPLPAFVDAVVRIKLAAAATHHEPGASNRGSPTRSSRPVRRFSAASTAISSSSTCIRPAPAHRTT